jgi:hypothetical protein
VKLLKILGIGVAVVVLAVGGGIVSWVMLVGPRMVEQPHIKPFQARMPMTPAGVVPVDPEIVLPTAEDAARLKNPLAATAENIACGKTYYEYYCIFCHGEQGDGAGPVGEAYLPVPADLRSRKILSYSDGQMLRAMLLGEGHAPVLERTVYPEHRWYLVLYVRQFDWAKPAP